MGRDMEPKGIDTAVVLAAGAGQRLHPLTADIPKALLPVDGDRTILDVILARLASRAVGAVRIVVGFAADEVRARIPAMGAAHGVVIETVDNDRPDRNNAYSLWVGLGGVGDGVLIVNGDTLFDGEVLTRLRSSPATGLVLAVDGIKALGDEEMKVRLTPDGLVGQISKGLDPAGADGEFIGVALVGADAVAGVVAALEAAWRRDPGLYYEDAFADLAAAGTPIAAVEVGDLRWIEVDTPGDLDAAREMLCRS